MEEMFCFFAILVPLTIITWLYPNFMKKKIEGEFASNPEIMSPDGKSAFKLFTFNLIGATLFGNFRHCKINGEDTYVSYYCICFIIPLIPLRCYRVIEKGNSYYFIGSDRMKWKELLCVYFDALKWVFAILLGLGILIVVTD